MTSSHPPKSGNAAGKFLVVSLHDVSPLTRPVFEQILADLTRWGVRRCSLLVIPDHHHRGHMLADAGFCRWLEKMAKLGHELVVHGYYHQRAARPNESWKQRFITRTYTQGEGEFYDLSRDDAAELLDRAKADFCRLDAPRPSGFVAPAWLLSRGADAAVQEAGFRYTTYLTGVKNYRTPSKGFIPARSLVYSPRNRWRRTASLLYVSELVRRLRNSPLIRLGLHPPDYGYSNLWGQVQRVVWAALQEREATTYEEYVGCRNSGVAS